MKFECPLLLTEDTDRFVKSLEKLSHSTADLDAMKLLAVPTVDSASITLIKCQYFIEINLSYTPGWSKYNLNLKVPILVCRPIFGIPIPAFPQPYNHPTDQMTMISPETTPETP